MDKAAAAIREMRLRGKSKKAIARELELDIKTVRRCAEEYDHSGDLARQPESLLEFFRSATGGRALDLTRKRDTTRRIKW